MVKKSSVLTLLVLLSGPFPSLAEDKISPPNPPADRVAPAAAVAAPSAAPSAAAPDAKRQSEIKPAKATEELKDKTSPKASQKEINKYMSKVAGLIAVQARKVGSIGSGSATLSFRINESGGIDSIAVRSSTAPKYAEAARRMLSGIHAGPPPGGSISLNQKFQFN
jgi:hypothetical protein